MEQKSLIFPEGFLWGAATSSYQIEGGLINDWSQWEKSERRLSYLKKKGLNPADYQSGKAANSWEMMEADIECLKKINANAYRFSIEWSRVEPEEGRFDEAVLARYANFIGRLQEEGIEPFVTLWHWPLPLWLSAKGGWTNSSIINYFKIYTERLVQAFPTVKFWITLNEPEIYAGNGFLHGIWPPAIKNPLSYLGVIANLIKAHRVAYDTIKESNSNTEIGIASPNINFEAAPGIINRILKAGAEWWWNNRFLNKISDKQDFIGLNFYFHNLINYGFSKNKNEKVNDMGWELYPAGIYPVLRNLANRYQKPIYITENGTADQDDDHRAWFIKEILKEVRRALDDEVDIRGYLHWSLIDNFEWAHGFEKKFGLFEVDYKTFERRPRPSALEYGRIIKNNSIDQ